MTVVDIIQKASNLLGTARPGADRVQVRKSQLLGAFTLALIVGFGVYDTFGVLSSPSYVVPWIGYVFLFAAFAVNRWISHTASALITMSMFQVVVFGSIYGGYTQNPAPLLMYLVLGVILGSFFFSVPGLLAYGSLNVLGIILLPVLVPHAVSASHPTGSALAINAFATFLIVLLKLHRNLLEAENRDVLMRQQALYRSIFDSVHDAVFLIRVDLGRVIQANARAVYLFGYSEEELKRISPARIIGSEPPFSVREARRLAMRAAEGNPQLVEWRARKKDGSYFWADISMQQATIADEERLLVTVRDISDKRRTENEKLIVDKRLRSVWEKSFDGMRINDGDGTIVDANDAFCRIVHLPREKVIGRPFWELYTHRTPEERQSGVDDFRNRISARVLPHDEIGKIVLWDGSEKWLSVSRSFLQSEGTSALVLSIFRDVTDRREAELARERLDQRFRRVWEKSLDGMRIVNGEGTIVDANAAYCQIVGLRKQDVIGKRFWEVYRPDSPDYADRSIEALKRRIRDQRLHRDEIREVHLWDGSMKWLAFTNAFLEFSPQEALILSIFRDVSELKQQEADILRLNQDLEHRVEERTKDLQEAVRELESFSYSVSHDLRAPLRHIAGYSEMASNAYEAGEREKGRTYMTTAIRSATRLGHLIDQLLAFSRIGRSELRFTGVNLRELVGDVQREIMGHSTMGSITWEVEDLPTVQADPTLLRQVIVNLLENAVKFTGRSDGAKIRITARSKDGFIEVTVEDNGAGFDMTYADKLFGVFQRLHSDSEFEGTGIGLANVRRIIERHGGTVWAKGEEGKGASFSFSLPVRPVASPGS